MRFILSLLFTITLSVSASAAPELRIVRGADDTVRSRKLYVVGVTEPGNKACVNGENVHVFKTGAFGSELLLAEGSNHVIVTVTDSCNTTCKEWDVLYTTKPAPTNPKPADLYREVHFNALTKEGAFLQSGDGGKGTKKMGYIDEGIPISIVGEKGDLYKLRLAAGKYAYIPAEYVEKGTVKPNTAHTGEWILSNDGRYDMLSLPLTEKRPYSSQYLADQSTIVIDIYGVIKKSGLSTSYPTSIITNVNILQTSSDILRISIKLKGGRCWGYGVKYEDDRLVIRVKHKLPSSLEGLRIGLDAGHGGDSFGAESATGIKEKDVNLKIVYETKRLLEQEGAEIVLSRKDDSDISMARRKQIFLEEEIDLLVSVHNNSGGSPLSALGTSTYYRYPYNRELASCILTRMLELGNHNFGMKGNFGFSLNGPTEYPNALVECLFMSSLAEEEKLADELYLKKIARKIASGIEDFVKQNH